MNTSQILIFDKYCRDIMELIDMDENDAWDSGGNFNSYLWKKLTCRKLAKKLTRRKLAKFFRNAAI